MSEVLSAPENPKSEMFGEQPFIDARYDGDKNIWLRIGHQSFKLASIDPDREEYPDRGDGWMMKQLKKAIDHLTTYMICGGKNLSSQHAEAVERAFKNGWACGYMSGGKDAHPGAPGKTCAQDLAAYKEKIA